MNDIYLYDPLGDSISFLEVVDYMGTDLTHVNAARESYDKNKKTFDDKDERLLNRLLSYPHTSPFYHAKIQFRVKCPLFVRNQWWKHVIGSSYQDRDIAWNETSLRFVDKTKEDHKPEFYIPHTWRAQHKTDKQASGENLSEEQSQLLRVRLKHHCINSVDAYNLAIQVGASRELARMFLPPNIYITFTWTASVWALIHFLKLRDNEGAQQEIMDYAVCLRYCVEGLFPNMYEAILSHEFR